MLNLCEAIGQARRLVRDVINEERARKEIVVALQTRQGLGIFFS